MKIRILVEAVVAPVPLLDGFGMLVLGALLMSAGVAYTVPRHSGPSLPN